MSKRSMRISFSSGIDKLMEHNESFDSGVLRVAYTGRNRNNSFISKETFERCIETIFNCPIVCRYDRDTDSIGSHDMELVSDDDGNMRIVNITQPVGVIPESARYWWEEIEDDSGIHEYLCVDALLWKRQEAYKKIKTDGITDESMEITVKEGEMVDGVYVIKQFEFTAFCLLGSSEPCFESASLEMFSCESFKQQFAQMMQDFKELNITISPSSDGLDNSKNFTEGGDETLEQKNEILAKFGLTVEQLDFNIETMSADELEAELSKRYSGENVGDGETTSCAAPATNTEPEDNTGTACGNDGNYSLMGEQFRDELISSLSTETIETCFGEMARYWYVDYDAERSEVYCYDMDDWKLYGFTYSMNGDNVVVDFDTKTRKKFAIVDFDEGEQTSTFEKVFAVLSERHEASDNNWSEKYQEANNKAASMQAELDELRQYKETAETAIETEKREQLLSRFEDLSGNEAFEQVCEHASDYSVEELEEKCYAIRGRMNSKTNFSLEHQKTPKLRVEKPEPNDEPYGGIFAKYGFTPEK